MNRYSRVTGRDGRKCFYVCIFLFSGHQESYCESRRRRRGKRKSTWAGGGRGREAGGRLVGRPDVWSGGEVALDSHCLLLQITVKLWKGLTVNSVRLHEPLVAGVHHAKVLTRLEIYFMIRHARGQLKGFILIKINW